MVRRDNFKYSGKCIVTNIHSDGCYGFTFKAAFTSIKITLSGLLQTLLLAYRITLFSKQKCWRLIFSWLSFNKLVFTFKSITADKMYNIFKTETSVRELWYYKQADRLILPITSFFCIACLT